MLVSLIVDLRILISGVRENMNNNTIEGLYHNIKHLHIYVCKLISIDRQNHITDIVYLDSVKSKYADIIKSLIIMNNVSLRLFNFMKQIAVQLEIQDFASENRLHIERELNELEKMLIKVKIALYRRGLDKLQIE